MRIVITAERAFSDGISPKELRRIVAWHDARAELIARSLEADGKKKRKKIGTEADVVRHAQIAEQIDHVADRLERLLALKAAA